MKKLLIILMLAVTAPYAVQSIESAQSGQAADAAFAFVNVSVIPMDRETVLADQTVVVRGKTQRAEDAVVLNSDQMNADEVFERILALVK